MQLILTDCILSHSVLHNLFLKWFNNAPNIYDWKIQRPRPKACAQAKWASTSIARKKAGQCKQNIEYL